MEKIRIGRWLTIHELASRHAPRDLIEEVLPERGLATLFGPPSSYKSFVALDMCLSVASGRPWAGHNVLKGPTAYIAAEGAGGVQSRVLAWLRSNEGWSPEDRFRVRPERVHLLRREEVDGLIHSFQDFSTPPSLVVVDTLARSIPGADENSAGVMGSVIEAADRVKTALGCCVLLVHHSGNASGRERGSTALRAGVDVRWETRRDDRRTTLHVDLHHHKRKEGAQLNEPIALRLDEVELDEGRSSLVVHAADQPKAPSQRFQRVVDALQDYINHYGEDPSQTKLVEAIGGNTKATTELVKEAAAHEQCPIETYSAARGAIKYRFTDQFWPSEPDGEGHPVQTSSTSTEADGTALETSPEHSKQGTVLPTFTSSNPQEEVGTAPSTRDPDDSFPTAPPFRGAGGRTSEGERSANGWSFTINGSPATDAEAQRLIVRLWSAALTPAKEGRVSLRWLRRRDAGPHLTGEGRVAFDQLESRMCKQLADECRNEVEAALWLERLEQMRHEN